MISTNEKELVTRDQVRKFLFEKFPACQKNDLKDEESLIETGIIDSMGMLELVVFVESDFGIEVEDLDLVPENFESVEALSKFVESKLEN
jgi:acyl carrier protein